MTVYESDPPRDILIVDDEPTMAQLIAHFLEMEGYHTRVAHEADPALEAARQRRPDLLICDIRLGPVEGFYVLAEIRRIYPGMPAVIVTGFPSVETRQRARASLAFDYLEKPFDRETLVRVVQRAFLSAPADEPKVLWAPEMLGLFGSSPAMRRVYREIHELARTDTPALIIGESGSGKERVARAIHHLSHRKDQPFQIMYSGCFAPEDELRDLERLARTGGALFIDDVTRLAPPTQQRVQIELSSTLGHGEVVVEDRPGRSSFRDCRLLFASRLELGFQGLTCETGAKEDRTDIMSAELFERIGSVTLRVPPLRERLEDLPQITRHHLEIFGRELGKPDLELMDSALDRLGRESWVGNIRELVAVIRRLVLAATRRHLRCEEIEAALASRHPPPDPTRADIHPGLSLEEARRRAVRSTLAALDQNVAVTARLLGLDRRTVMRYRSE